VASTANVALATAAAGHSTVIVDPAATIVAHVATTRPPAWTRVARAAKNGRLPARSRPRRSHPVVAPGPSAGRPRSDREKNEPHAKIELPAASSHVRTDRPDRTADRARTVRTAMTAVPVATIVAPAVPRLPDRDHGRRPI
jgi:hypothetical protein